MAGMIPRVHFDPEAHVYSVGGRVFPSVTQILAEEGLSHDFTGVDPFYAERGTAVHAAAEILLSGREIEPETIDEHVAPYLDCLRRHLDDEKPEGLFIEEPMADVARGYAGTPDLFTLAQVLDDYKAGAPHASHAFQLAGYRGLLDVRGYRTKLSRIVYLKPKGRAVIREIPASQIRHDDQVFGAALLLNLTKKGFRTL